MRPFDIAPFALPNHPSNELRFEEPRDITRIVVTFRGAAPAKLGLSYLRQHWPHNRTEQFSTNEGGWGRADDLFRSAWHKAAIRKDRLSAARAAISFKGLETEFGPLPEIRDYNVTFRRTLGIRIDAPPTAAIRRIEVFTRSAPIESILRVELDAGKKTRATRLTLSGYNAVMKKIVPGKGSRMDGELLKLDQRTRRRTFLIHVLHMHPASAYCYDDGLVTLGLGRDAFTVSLAALSDQGPVWYAEKGMFITREGDPTTFAQYKESIKGSRTVAQRVMNHREQSFGGARLCQPRPHPGAFCIGCKRARQSFWIEPNGDIVLHGQFLREVPGKDTPLFLNESNGRFFFGLERWRVEGRAPDPPPVLAYNIRLSDSGLTLEQKCFAVPLEKSLLNGELAGDDATVALVRFKAQNAAGEPRLARIPVAYSSDSHRAQLRLARQFKRHSDDLVPQSPLDKLAATDGRITGQWHGGTALRASYRTTMEPRPHGDGLLFIQELPPGASCELLLKVPYVALDSAEELAALDALDFDACYRDMKTFWLREGRRGAHVHTPEPRLDSVYALHLPIILMTDFAVPDDPALINTSVGTNTYRNFPNESSMIHEELDQRGLHDEARKRLEIYLKYQGKGSMLGNFTDYDGLFFDSGGFEGNRAYNQSHGWVMWRLADHYFMTGDDDWLKRVADSLVAAADWVFRQRRNTMKDLPNSRGWEYGFLPAGGLEDVDDHNYWLVNNVMSWRGTEWAARTLQAIGHPEAPRIRAESDAYRRDITQGLETSRRCSPVVRLRNGRWVPHYPSRLYHRGRDAGWIRELLEGSIHLLLSGLFDPHSRQADWILDDYQDNRYGVHFVGYPVDDPEAAWFANGGFSLQPNLLPGLLPHLDRDEPEIYIRMFFNAFASCYEEELNALIEHPIPLGGYYGYRSFKTSDQSNAMKWLVYMFVYEVGDLLHFGRALPREWLTDGNEIWARDVVAHCGRVSVTYRSHLTEDRITAELKLDLRHEPPKMLVRFRHPEKKPIKRVTINRRAHKAFDPATGDVDLSGMKGDVSIVASY